MTDSAIGRDSSDSLCNYRKLSRSFGVALLKWLDLIPILEPLRLSPQKELGMLNEAERRIRTAAQIANYGLYLGLAPYQIDQAVRVGMDALDGGQSGARAYQAGRKVVDWYVQKEYRLEA